MFSLLRARSMSGSWPCRSSKPSSATDLKLPQFLDFTPALFNFRDGIPIKKPIQAPPFLGSILSGHDLSVNKYVPSYLSKDKWASLAGSGVSDGVFRSLRGAPSLQLDRASPAGVAAATGCGVWLAGALPAFLHGCIMIKPRRKAGSRHGSRARISTVRSDHSSTPDMNHVRP